MAIGLRADKEAAFRAAMGIRRGESTPLFLSPHRH